MAVNGVNPFHNDGAGDLMMEIQNDPAYGLEIISEILEAVINPPVEGFELDVDICTAGIAAAELVAALNGNPSPDLPEHYAEWVGDKPTGTDKAMIADSLKAVERIRQKDTELYQLFEETSESPHSPGDLMVEWATVLNDLVKRLQSSL
ncbi:MAG: DUF4259 domain-containing protein [Chloroflexota bacterium]